MDRLRQYFCKYPAGTFTILTYAITWGIWGIGYLVLPEDVSIIPVVLLGGFGPAIAATLTTQAVDGEIRTWLADRLTWRVASRWYLAALLVPVALYGIAAVFLVALGATLQINQIGRGVALFLGGLPTATFLSGGNEELGWRGFLLPQLQQRYNAFSASLIVGVVWAGWHLPVYVLPLGLVNGPFSEFAVFTILLSITLTWMYNSTGSALLPMLMHGSLNSAIGIFVGILAIDALSESVVWGSRIVGAFCIAVILVVAYDRTTLADRSPSPANHHSID